MELTDVEVEALGTRGYFTRTSFLGEARALAARADALARVEVGSLQPAGIRRGADRTQDTRVRGDLIGWVQPEAGTPLGALRERFEALGQALSRGAYLGLGRFDLQLACYPGGGAHYARHLDAFPGQSNRRATAIWYANAGWVPEHGGVLRLHPEGEAPVDVAPGLDTLVVFLSERIEHEVLPAFHPRLALTAWFYGRDAG
ncbi:2OG-Fe(II) oxygenase [Myxococcus sp. K15C18031901]|uniref:2OG-Fe(II) oxygenase n=1 Tax=Myxococcus dinghuensis TaxID=2906761 RepID=UPI0020A72E5D|nr:2OG-Fe(II) oxygenase [Myxococcus dinghuensis]MCP3100137.1 2OG-Fe(II) oxygenase [Myxococcus dinghuensis]